MSICVTVWLLTTLMFVVFRKGLEFAPTEFDHCCAAEMGLGDAVEF